MLNPYERSAEVYDLYYSWLDYESHAETVHDLIQERIPGAGTLLELASGTARYTEQMARWYQVEGLDLSESMLAKARDRMSDTAFHRGDMTDFDLGRTYDAVICMFSSVAYLTTLHDLGSMIRCSERHLNPGGVLIIEPWFAPKMWRDSFIGSRVVEGDGVTVARLDTSVRDGHLATMHWAWSIARSDGTADAYVEEHATGLFTAEEYEPLFGSVGLGHEYDSEGLLGRGLHIGTKA